MTLDVGEFNSKTVFSFYKYSVFKRCSYLHLNPHTSNLNVLNNTIFSITRPTKALFLTSLL